MKLMVVAIASVFLVATACGDRPSANATNVTGKNESVAVKVPTEWTGDFDLDGALGVSGKSVLGLRIHPDGIVETWLGWVLMEMVYGEPKGRFTVTGNTARIQFADGSSLVIKLEQDKMIATSPDGRRFTMTRNQMGIPPGGIPLVPITPIGK